MSGYCEPFWADTRKEDMKHNYTGQLFDTSITPADGSIVWINSTVHFVDHDGYRVVFCRHEPIYRVALTDKQHLRLVAVSLRQTGLATQEEIAAAFRHGVATQRRWEERYQSEALDGLVDKVKTGRQPTIDESQHAFLIRWFHARVSVREMARRLAVSKSAVGRELKRLGLRRQSKDQPPLPFAEDQAEAPALPGNAAESGEGTEVMANELPQSQATIGIDAPVALQDDMASSEDTWEAPETATVVPTLEGATESDARPEPLSPGTLTVDGDPADRSGDRLLARQGLIDDALPLFADAEQLPRAGVLLAVPLLVNAGVLQIFEKIYGSLGPSFYGLRTIVVTLVLMALLRIKRPENLKEYRPSEIGQLLGLDRAPEVKTVRRKLGVLAAQDKGKELMDELAERRIQEQQERIAFLYLDGHVREYHGSAPLAKTKKSQRPRPAPAATDTWVHDAAGEPLLVVPSEMNDGLTKVLEPILKDVKQLAPEGASITVIFDRGGFSPKLFASLIAAGFDVITYRKGKSQPLPASSFSEQTEVIDGRQYCYRLCDRPRVRVGQLRGQRKRRRRDQGPRYLWLREIRVLRDDGRQTPVLTNRHDLSAVAALVRIFGRWRQENYFKYMAAEFALDALVEYGVSPVAAETTRPNPQRTKLQKQLDKATVARDRLRAELGKEVEHNKQEQRPSMRGFKIAHAELRRQLAQAEQHICRLRQELSDLPKRIAADELRTLKPERKLIVDAIKMTAYQLETQLLGMLAGHYARVVDEGRTFLHAVFQSPAHLEVSADELRVTIAAQSSLHRTLALSKLCQQLDDLAVSFPGTTLRLRFAVEPHEPLSP